MMSQRSDAECHISYPALQQRIGKALLHVVVGDLLGRTHAECQRLIRGVVGNVDLKHRKKTGCVTSSPGRFRAKGRSSSTGDHAEVCWRLPCAAGVERRCLPQSPRVGKGPRQNEHRQQRAQHGKTEGFDYITGVSEAAHALAGLSSAADEPERGQSSKRGHFSTILINAACCSTGKEHQARLEGRGCAYRRVGQRLVDKLRVIKVPHLSCHPPCQDVQ